MEPAALPIADGVWRITTPMPSRPRTVHAYLAALSGGGWMLVDGGIDSEEAWSALRAGLDEAGCELRDLALHVVTHMHVDHVGLAARLRAAGGPPLAMGALDAERAAHAHADPDEEAAYRESLLRVNGAPEAFVRLVLDGNRALAAPRAFVPADHALRGDPAPLPGSDEWVAIPTPGHTAGHVSLLRAPDGLLIGGDALLPRVTPTIGINRQSADAVADALGTLARLRTLPIRRILPGHGEPIAPPGERLDEMVAEIRTETARIAALLSAEPTTAWDVARARYAGRELPPEQSMQALRETLAHLTHLVATGAALSDTEQGVVRFWPS